MALLSGISGILQLTTTSQPPTVASSDLPFPMPVPSFAWSNFPATLDTCTSATINWTYSGTPDLIQFVLVPQVSSRTNAALANKRSTGNTTIATRVHLTALAWTWPKVNASAGEYVLQASGTWVNVASSSFAINNGADTSCLAVAVTSATSTTPSSEPSSSTTPLPTTSGRGTGNTGVIAGGAVAGVVVLIIALLGCRLWARQRKQQLRHPHNPTEATHRDTPSLYVASGAPSPALPFSEKSAGRPDSLDSPLSPNHRPPSFLLSDPYTPVPPYPSHTQAREQGARLIMDVTTIGSRSSAALSDATSTTGLMRTFSSCCPPSYATRPSLPPSYTTYTTRDTMTSRSTHFSYASSS
ncbi:hypothetical protein GSI_11000 [Ganoderma sinense ZZ0214-1]|uniref:Uncharacterized protein n=1 Tax=Ganoderma sinense ZZ0214-1 TaxID=1077348 RepID=A0A2G8S254_9APHY|nr:hypothetical protein GSI_11000 [Ganoderma sinense ZZ0214-1]